jgi:hypothetical protein
MEAEHWEAASTLEPGEPGSAGLDL